MKEAPPKRSKICDNCRGNGYLTVIDNTGKTNVHQCWVCESEGEIKNMIKVKLMILFIVLILVSGCSEFALLASGSSSSYFSEFLCQSL